MRAWQKTCLPASSAEIVTAECMYGVVPIQTTSMSGVATNSAQSRIGTRRQRILAAEAFRALVCGVRNCDNFHVGVVFESRQMASTNDVAGSYDSDPQFVIIFVH